MLQIETFRFLAKVESMIEPDTDIGTEYKYFQVHKARYFETLRIFNQNHKWKFSMSVRWQDTLF